MKNVHIGKLLEQLVLESGMKKAYVADAINMTPQGLNKVFNKDLIHQDLIEKFMKLLNINLYKYLSERWENKEEQAVPLQFKEPLTEYEINSTIKKGTGNSSISLLINVDESKKDEVLKMIFQ